MYMRCVCFFYVARSLGWIAFYVCKEAGVVFYVFFLFFFGGCDKLTASWWGVDFRLTASLRPNPILPVVRMMYAFVGDAHFQCMFFYLCVAATVVWYRGENHVLVTVQLLIFDSAV